MMAGHPGPGPRRPWRVALALTAILAATALATCGGNPEPPVEFTAEGADALLFELGQEALVEERWDVAREYFVQIRDNYPQSELRDDARIGVVETYEGEGSPTAFVSALGELREFLRLYPPTHPLGPQAQYKLGMVYYNQMRRPERDQSETGLAIEEFERFMQQYSEYSSPELIEQVRSKLREARDRLSDSSYLVGRYYYRADYFPGAVSRFREILDEDPGYTRRDQVYFHLADSLAQMNRTAEALPYFERLVEEFPNTEFLEDANRRIAELKVAMDLDQ